MKPTKGIVCRECRGVNQPGSSYCWYCGASLPKRWSDPAERPTFRQIAPQIAKWVVSMVVVLGVLAGIYYAIDHYVIPVFRDNEDSAGTIASASSSTSRSTTTTTVPRTDRVIAGGADRYETAIAISKLGFPEEVSTLVLTAGDDYAQAISVTPLAAAYDGPVLLVPPEGLRDDLSAEIQRLNPSQVFLVGLSRPSRVTTQLEDILEDPTVTKLSGDNAYETAALVAQEIKAKLGKVSKVVIVPSNSFVEAIAVAPLAAAKGWPILLGPESSKNRTTVTDAILETGATSALLVNVDIELTLSDVEELTETDAYKVTALIIDYGLAHGLSFAHTTIVTGGSFPDGLVAGSYLALDKGTLLLAQDGKLPSVLYSQFSENLHAIRTLDIIALPELAKDLANTAEEVDPDRAEEGEASTTGTA